MTALAQRPLHTVGWGLPPPTDVVTDVDMLMYQIQRVPSGDNFNNRMTVPPNTMANTRPYQAPFEPQLWDSINNMQYTRFKPSTVVPDYTGMLVNTGSMIFWTLLVVGAMSIFLKE